MYTYPDCIFVDLIDQKMSSDLTPPSVVTRRYFCRKALNGGNPVNFLLSEDLKPDWTSGCRKVSEMMYGQLEPTECRNVLSFIFQCSLWDHL